LSFRCEMCKTAAEDGQKPMRIVTKTRVHEHPKREKVYRRRDLETGEIEKYDDPGGIGTQIVKEVNACKECAEQWNRAREEEKRAQRKLAPQAKASRPMKV